VRFGDFKVLTFDCYGTLIDWEKGILRALSPLVERSARGLSREEILACFARCESEEEAATPRAKSLMWRKVFSTITRRPMPWASPRPGSTAEQA
jgi:FMN phosphatase YigB (HAD superfamily)